MEIEPPSDSQRQRESTSNELLSSELSFQVHDPNTWPAVISDALWDKIVKSGLVQSQAPMNKKYPVNKHGRSFKSKYFYSTKPNGKIYKRDWLLYSSKSDSVYCLFCSLFVRNENAFCAIGRGFSDWRNFNRDAKSHESHVKHHTQFKTWLDYSKRLVSNETIDAHQQKLLNKETEHWKEVMKRLISSVQFLAQQSLAFRGHTSTLYDKNNGNFLKLMEMLAKFDPVMTDHLNRVVSTSQTHYLSNRIQNELIECLASAVTKIIINSIKESEYYSIIVDCTSDLSHEEQMAIIIRYVIFDPKENKYKIEERFLSYSVCTDQTGEGITNAICSELKKYNLDLQNLRGQGYDNGANMAGVNIGVKTRMLKENSLALPIVKKK